jgi:hypothetical protein
MGQESKCIVHSSGLKEWRLNGKLHRLDGPALEETNGAKQWWLNGKLHRINGPAFERADGTKEWWLNGKLHCTDGPALEWADGTKVWYINGERLGGGDEGFWALWQLLNEEQRSSWKLLQHTSWVK